MKGICKHFPGVQALKNVDFTLADGEILGLVGENGAGKSTLMKVLTGVYHPEAGEIFYQGQRLHLTNPGEAYRQSISIIFSRRS